LAGPLPGLNRGGPTLGGVWADLRRRSVLAAAGAAVSVLATGCKGVGGLGTRPRPRPDVAVLRAAIGAEQALIARYRSALDASPGLKPTLEPVLDQHLAHLSALRSRLIGAAVTPLPETSAAAGQAGSLGALADAEQAAAAALVSRLATASPSLAQLLASISASEASHAALLRTHRSTP
jgi:Ferritin-like domain